MQSGNAQKGFSLIEVLVVMVVFSIIIVAASQMFTSLLFDFKKQSKIAATNIEGMLGLEVMRRDIASAGYGLYWSQDPKTAPTSTPFTAAEISAADVNGSALNDDLTIDGPRALVFGAWDGTSGGGLNGSDRFAIRSMNAAANSSSELFNYLYISPTFTTNSWTPSSYNIVQSDYVVVMKVDDSHRWLTYTKTQKFADIFQNMVTSYASGTASGGVTSIVFSLGTNSTPRFPFNRADYYIANTNVPSRCAAGTGVLYKAVMDQRPSGTGFLSAIPILDCVADMQVAYRFDSSGGDFADLVTDVTPSAPWGTTITVFPASDFVVNPDDDSPSVKARQIREVRVYILAQEGQRDNQYTYPNSSVWVGEAGYVYGRAGATDSVNLGRQFDLTQIANWQHYRWKVYTLIVSPICLKQWGGSQL